MKPTRREALLGTLFGAGMIGLRALATGLPASFLLNPRRAMAAGMPDAGTAAAATCADKTKAQFIILATSGLGDPINANVPGTYEDAMIAHPTDPSMAATAFMLAGQSVTAAKPWSTLPQAALDRTAFFHLMTNTPVHPKEPDVLKLMGTTQPAEMLPSLLAKQLAPCLGTIQAQPITLGATSPSEGLSFGGTALPIIPPLALKSTLTNPTGPLSTLQPLRDQTLSALGDVYRKGATKAQRAYLDSLAISQQEVRGIRQDLLSSLGSIKDNSISSQITAALALVQMKVTPVICVHIPFGGDNHHDAALATETAQTISGVAAINELLSQLASLGLADQVTFLSLNVFGRTIGPANTDGRQHNQNHQLSMAIGKPFRGGVIGGVRPLGGDYGCMAIDSKTGMGVSGGDIIPTDSLASFGKTAMAAVGIDQATIDYAISSGQVITPALS